MSDRPLLIYGAGHHGEVLAEAARLAGWSLQGFIDDRAPDAQEVMGLAVHPAADWLQTAVPGQSPPLALALGDNRHRFATVEKLQSLGLELATIIHPAAFVSPSATVEPGVFVGPRAVVHVAARLGVAALVNSGAVVEHHNVLGAASHVAPGAALTGRVQLGDRAFVGAGASVIPDVNIGDDAIVGAGAVVIADVPAGATVVGSPARRVERD